MRMKKEREHGEGNDQENGQSEKISLQKSSWEKLKTIRYL